MELATLQQELIFWITSHQFFFLGLGVALIPLALLFFFSVRRIMLLQKHLAVATEKRKALTQELTSTQERLASSDKELALYKTESKKLLSTLLEEKKQDRWQYEDLLREHAQMQSDLAMEKTKNSRITELQTERDEARMRVEDLHREKNILTSQISALQSIQEEERRAAQGKIHLLEQAELRLTREFENLANRIFDEKQQRFHETSKRGLESLFEPMRNQLGDFRKKIEDIYDSENRERASLRAEITHLQSLNERISTDALNLTRALKGNSKIRGNWGEMQLACLLEEAGLREGYEFELQRGFRNETGQRLQPDAVVHLPGQRDVIIDAKVSLLAYEQYHSAENEAEQQRALRSHIASLRAHFSGLGAKNYEKLDAVQSLDLVIMFVPLDSALLLAFEKERHLFAEAFARGVLLAGPSMLMAVVQIIHAVWRRELQNNNARIIAEEAGKLHDQFASFIEVLEKLGEQIHRAADGYALACKQLYEGRGNLIWRAQKLHSLGAPSKKTISKGMVNQSTGNADATQSVPETQLLAQGTKS